MGGFLVKLAVSLVTVTVTPAGYTVVKGSDVCMVSAPDAYRPVMVVTVSEETAHAMFPATGVCK